VTIGGDAAGTVVAVVVAVAVVVGVVEVVVVPVVDVVVVARGDAVGCERARSEDPELHAAHAATSSTHTLLRPRRRCTPS
jgi:hypothetical protein